MKIHWKMLVGRRLDRRGRDRTGTQHVDPGPGCGRLEAVVPGRRLPAKRAFRINRGSPNPPPGRRSRGTESSRSRPPDRGARAQDGPGQAADRADDLEAFGTTDYDPATVTVVRTQFDSRVDKVLVDLGTTVKQGDPLLELFSTDLAEAKSNYEAAISQWARDKKVLDYKTPLADRE